LSLHLSKFGVPYVSTTIFVSICFFVCPSLYLLPLSLSILSLYLSKFGVLNVSKTIFVSICVFVCLSVSLCVYHFICLSLGLLSISVSLAFDKNIFMSICIEFICLCICPHMGLPTCFYDYIFVFPCLCLSINLFVTIGSIYLSLCLTKFW
jgi:hypothetical protein